jgi:transposase-like protein
LAKKTARITLWLERHKNRRARGRPGLLTPELADALVARVSDGATIDEAARSVGISARSVRAWRRRAWSSSPTDAPYIALERRLLQAQALASPPAVDWRAIAARLDAEDEHWLTNA